jgi:hypothetical protein
MPLRALRPSDRVPVGNAAQFPPENVRTRFLSLRHRHCHTLRVAGRARSAPRPSSRCQTARRVICPRSPSRSRGAFARPGCCVRLALSPPHPSCRYRFGERARCNLGDSLTSDPEMRGPAERREAYYPGLSRLWGATPRLRGVGRPAQNRDPASRRSTVALSAQEPLRTRHYLRIRPGGCSRPAIAHGGLRPRAFRSTALRAAIDATPRSACWIVSGDAPHERGWRLYTTSSHRSQEINANRSRFWQANLERLSRRGFIPISPSRHSDAP